MEKKRLFLLLLFACLSFATISKAQTLITSTSASTTIIEEEEEPTRSGRVKGLVLRPETCIGYGSRGFVTGLEGTLAYQFNPYISLGGGYGWDVCNGLNSVWFANFRVYFCDRRVSPFYDLKLGKKTSSTFGLQVKGFDFSWSLSALFTNNRTYFMGTFNFAYNIQFGKKQKE